MVGSWSTIFQEGRRREGAGAEFWSKKNLPDLAVRGGDDLEVLLIQSNTLNMFGPVDLRLYGRLRALQAGQNRFVCSCEFVSFMVWRWGGAVEGSVELTDRLDNYLCDSPLPLQLHAVWYMSMMWAWLRAKRNSGNRKRRDAARNADPLCYDAFVSYSERDAEWVEEFLVPELENSQPPLSLCLHKRDFLPGHWIMDNIINAMDRSRRTLFVLSEHFVHSEWCRYNSILSCLTSVQNDKVSRL
ncbi:unnamed protein product [Coregonus sp. 'balchen']|nr:unnamed protein product [Coregonus sp. 'balchen']